MPYVSDAQRRYMHWAKAHGKIKPKVVEEFDEATPKGAKLPERVQHVKHAAFLDELQKIYIPRPVIEDVAELAGRTILKRQAASSGKLFGAKSKDQRA